MIEDDDDLGLPLDDSEGLNDQGSVPPPPPPVRPETGPPSEAISSFLGSGAATADDPFAPAAVSIEPSRETAHSSAGAGIGGAKARDRIVVLGRRRAGKTIYLSRLYESAWNGQFAGLHMRAIPGPGNGHERFMETISQLRDGGWPESTVGSTTTPIDVEYQGQTHLLIALDYPGEVFRRAFVQGSEEEAALELRDHVDRAAGVILLLDPDVAVTGRIEETVDDDYGMSEAIRRIRTQPGGAEVPIALVLTKCDAHQGLIREEGGLRSFFQKHYHNILRVAKKPSKMFAAAAVRVRRDARGSFLPTLKHDSINVLEPMVYCISMIQQQRSVVARTEAHAAQQAFLKTMAAEEAEDSRRQSMRWAIGIVVAILGAALLVFLNYWFFIRKEG
ncbi:GTPase domain-containing protein [bacterium]|nr:GTPase domain-containing protein [bacterium]